MNLAFKFKDSATVPIDGLAELVTSPGALEAGGIKLRDSIVANFATLPANKRFPGASTGYWQQAAESVTSPVISGKGATISITHVGVRFNFYGGTIRAPWKNGSTVTYLTLPAQEAAYGHRAREFTDLTVAFLGRSPSGLPILALVRGMPRISSKPMVPLKPRKPIQTAPRKQAEASLPPGKKLNVMYWLVPELTKAPNPAVLPTEPVMKTAFISGVRAFTNGTLRRNAVKLKDFS